MKKEIKNIKNYVDLANELAVKINEIDNIDDFLDKVLDYEFTLDSNLDIIKSELLLSYGGPTTTISLDGKFIKIKCSGGSDYSYEKIIEDNVHMFEYIEEIYLCKLENKKYF